LNPNVEHRLFESIMRFKYDPVGFVNYAFPWGEEHKPLAEIKGLRKWQLKEFERIGEYVVENERLKQAGKPMKVLYVSICSGRGIGKSAFLSMLNYWFMSCWFGGTAVITANTETQLRTRTMAEVGKWHAMAINNHWFSKTSLSIKPAKWFKELLIDQLSIDPAYYYCEGQNWSEENPDAFAGLHSHVGTLLSFDEASGISDSIYRVSEGFFTDPSPIRIWVAISNGRRNTGSFFESFNEDKEFWNNTNIDSRTVEGVDTAAYERMAKKYGEDSDTTRVEVRGLFPIGGDNKFIDTPTVDEAIDRELSTFDNLEPLIMGVDVARAGKDKSTIVFRQGRDARSLPSFSYDEKDTMVFANIIIAKILEFKPVKCFVDGCGIGGAVIDRLNQLGYGYVVMEANAAKSPDDKERYVNKRAEMWDRMREWLSTGCINDDIRLELTAPLDLTHSESRQGKILLESKEDMLKRGSKSPDLADALSFTFANRVANIVARNSRRVVAKTEYCILRH